MGRGGEGGGGGKRAPTKNRRRITLPLTVSNEDGRGGTSKHAHTRGEKKRSIFLSPRKGEV